MSIVANVDLNDKLSYNKETIFLTTKAFQVQVRVSIDASSTYYFAMDPTAMTKRLGTFPLSLSSANGLVLADTYQSTLSSVGTTITLYKITSYSKVDPVCIIRQGVTPTITSPSQSRAYIIGTKATNQSSGSGAQTVDLIKTIDTTIPIVIKLANQETSANIVSVGIVWFEF